MPPAARPERPPGRPVAPIWLIGLTQAAFGFYGGLVAIAIPELLAARHVPAETIARLTAMLLLPGALCFLACPVLDVRFSRRAWAIGLNVFAAAALVIAFLNVGSIAVLEICVLLGYTAINLYQAACGGWYATVVPGARQATLSAWINVANIGAGGLMATLVTELLRLLPLPFAASLFGLLILLPLAVFPFIPAPGPDRRLARDSFRALFAAVLSMLRRRDVLVVMLLFASPAAGFALTNLVAGYGAVFGATERQTSLLAGAGVAVAGILAATLGGPLCARLPLRRLYLATGILGACFTLGMVLLPRTPAVFGLVMLGENAFQSFAFTVSTTLSLRTVGHGNPVAATEYGILTCAVNVPLIYMQFADARGYSLYGLAGAFGIDAGVSIVVAVCLLCLLWWLARRQEQKQIPAG